MEKGRGCPDNTLPVNPGGPLNEFTDGAAEKCLKRFNVLVIVLFLFLELVINVLMLRLMGLTVMFGKRDRSDCDAWP